MILNLIKSPSRRTSDRERLMNICARIPGAGLARSAVIIILAATGGRLGTHARIAALWATALRGYYFYRNMLPILPRLPSYLRFPSSLRLCQQRLAVQLFKVVLKTHLQIVML